MAWFAALPAIASLVGSAMNYKNSKRGNGGGYDGGYGGDFHNQEAIKYLDQIPGVTAPYYQPFIESGKQASNSVNPIYQQMSESPGAFIEQLMRGYTPSRGYQFKQGEMEKAMRNEAAHGGFVGTPYSQQQQGELTQGLLSQDMQQFLQNLLGAQNTGFQGQENRINRGFGASTDYGGILGSNLANKAYLDAQGRAQQMGFNQSNMNRQMDYNQANRNARSGFLSQMLGAGGSLAGDYFGGKFGGRGAGGIRPYQMGNNAF